MRRPLSKISHLALTLVAAGLVAGGCSSSAARSADAPTTIPTTSAPSSTASPATQLHVRFTNVGPLPAFGAMFCQGKHCLLPSTETGTFHGDLEGTHITGSYAAPNGAAVAAARIDLFIGTVKGCGRGTFVAVGREEATATSGTGTADIAAGYGTGDLKRLTGHLRGSGTVKPDGIHSTFTGDFSCHG